MQIAAENSVWAVFTFSLGVTFTEVLYVWISVRLASKFLLGFLNKYGKWFGFTLLLLAGAYFIHLSLSPADSEKSTQLFRAKSLLDMFGMGLLINAMNPLQIIFWISILNVLRMAGFTSPTLYKSAFFNTGIATGTVMALNLFGLLGLRISQQSTLAFSTLYLGLGVMLLVLAAMLAFSGKTDYQEVYNRLSRLIRWEFWPSWTLYFPLTFYLLILGLRSRSAGFFAAANPSILNGGMVGELKSEIEKLIPSRWHPRTLVFGKGTSADTVLTSITSNDFIWPLIIKPDSGAKGRMVYKAEHSEQLKAFIGLYSEAFLVQEFCSYPNEIGVFYVKIPGHPHGKITGIVKKEPILLVGNGQQTIRQLLSASYRYSHLIADIIRATTIDLDHIPSAGESVKLSEIGNHARGSKFTDVTHLNSTQLEALFDSIINEMPGVYFGRFDIKYDTWQALERGEDFMIIEFNGTGSEPTHIFDPKHSYFFALREMATHWKWMYRIAIANHQQGHAFMHLREVIKLAFSKEGKV